MSVCQGIYLTTKLDFENAMCLYSNMKMNAYNPVITDLLKLSGVTKNQKLSKQFLYKLVLSYCDVQNMKTAFRGYHELTSQMMPTEYTLDRMTADSTTIFMMEAMNLYYGVMIHVEDANLLEALVRAKVDAVVGDVRLPFPCMEISMPSGISLYEDYEVNGAVVMDMRYFNIQRELAKENIRIGTVDSGGRPTADIGVLSRMKKKGTEDVDVCIHRFCRDQPLRGHFGEYLNETYQNFIYRQAELMMALMLYFQCYQDNREVLREVHHRPRFTGMPAAMAQIAKRRRSYHVQDMLGLSKEYERISAGGSHASPRPHWRTWTLRSLRHERFKRNPDGSVRVILVAPHMVGVKSHEDEVRGERVVSDHSGLQNAGGDDIPSPDC